MLVAVTGATGFVGRHVVRHLAERGHSLRCWKRPTSDLSGFESFAARTDWIDGTLRDPKSMDALVDGVDAVVHAAVDRDGRGFRESADADLVRFAQSNLVGSLTLMQKARQLGVGRFVFISSCAVHEVILDDRPLDELHPTWSTNHYGAHKAALEAFVYSYGLGAGWPICSLRPCGIYGVTHPPSASKYYDLVGDVLAAKPIATARGGKEVHAHDVARAIDLLLGADEKDIAGQAFNCCDQYVSEQQVATIAKELTGSDSTIESLNKGPKHQIDSGKLHALGMRFGAEPLLRKTIEQLLAAHRAG